MNTVEWKEYESMPIVRKAIRIEYDPIKLPEQESTYEYRGIFFKAHEQPKEGDWIVRLTEEDTYHVPDAVFRERNVVPE